MTLKTDVLDQDEKREWLLSYYEYEPPADCVYIDDVDIILAEVEKYVDNLDPEDVDKKYEKYKGTKTGAKVFEGMISNYKYWLNLDKDK